MRLPALTLLAPTLLALGLATMAQAQSSLSDEIAA